MYRQAVEIRLRTAGTDHFSTGWSMVWLGRTLLKLQRADEAAIWLERALPVYERSIGPDDAETMRVRDNLAEAVGAQLVPRVVAAEGIDRAHRRTATGRSAAGSAVGLPAASRTRPAVPAELDRLVDAAGVPRLPAAERILHADGMAASGIVATG